MSIDNSDDKEVDRLINLVEVNLGNWKAKTIVILDVNFKIWGKRGEISTEILNFYRKFPFREMHIGDTVHNENTYMMKITGKTAVLIEMRDSHIARLSAINLRGRINALSEFCILEDRVAEKSATDVNKTKEKLKKLEDLLNRIDEMLKNANKVFQE